jgi:hypothetical protein
VKKIREQDTENETAWKKEKMSGWDVQRKTHRENERE